MIKEAHRKEWIYCLTVKDEYKPGLHPVFFYSKLPMELKTDLSKTQNLHDMYQIM
jgi:hypothetical protein